MFEKIIAQDKAKKILSEQIKNNKIPHAYIFMGEEGTGKMLTAIEFAKILNCMINDYTKVDAGPCNHCLSCEHIDKGTFPDLHIINFDLLYNFSMIQLSLIHLYIHFYYYYIH